MRTRQGFAGTQSVEQAQQLLLQQATERATRAFLSSIANELRTPLVSIMGALSSLQEDVSPLDEETRQDLIENAAARSLPQHSLCKVVTRIANCVQVC